METYTTLLGEKILYAPPAPEVAAFLARVIDAANDPNVSESALIDLIYGPHNPILKQGVFPGHGMVTRETFANPIYHVMQDLLGRKRVQMGTLNIDAALDEHTVTVSEAAEMLGVHVSAVRQAIHAHRLAAVKRGGVWLISPRAIDSFHLSRRGPAPKRQDAQQSPAPVLLVRVGNAPGASFRLSVRGGVLRETGRQKHTVEGEIDQFESVAIRSGGDGKHRFFELRPAQDKQELMFQGFFVRGRFQIAHKENNPERALAAWREWHAKGKNEK